MFFNLITYQMAGGFVDPLEASTTCGTMILNNSKRVFANFVRKRIIVSIFKNYPYLILNAFWCATTARHLKIVSDLNGSHFPVVLLKIL